MCAPAERQRAECRRHATKQRGLTQAGRGKGVNEKIRTTNRKRRSARVKDFAPPAPRRRRATLRRASASQPTHQLVMPQSPHARAPVHACVCRNAAPAHAAGAQRISNQAQRHGIENAQRKSRRGGEMVGGRHIRAATARWRELIITTNNVIAKQRTNARCGVRARCGGASMAPRVASPSPKARGSAAHQHQRTI